MPYYVPVTIMLLNSLATKTGVSGAARQVHSMHSQPNSEGATTHSDDSTAHTEPDEHEADTDSSSSIASSLNGSHGDAAAAFFDRARDCLDEAIEALYHFGSVARHTKKRTSDVDILAVIADDADYAAIDDQLLDIAYDIQLDYGVPTEVHSIHASEFTARKNRGEPFIRTVIEEGMLDA
ncbi:nucleotidyltransferase domain-containing protein [Haladaptatus halobius]|uniref:nucleotidyltransferase domain-containing protein n=1 Tax=Haladaptatus halobius TaxID=2884875 RepID=UPI001D0AF395|nr:nucleotidyltransferase domain-containing protein [Haladaptatus halobius]